MGSLCGYSSLSPLEEIGQSLVDLFGSVIQVDQMSGVIIRHLSPTFGAFILVDMISHLTGHHIVMSNSTANEAR